MPLDLTPRQAEVLSLLLDEYERRLEGAEETELEDLTEREQEILILLASGRSYIEIAVRCTIAHSTVRNHVGNILKKFGVSNTRKAIAIALNLNILTLDQIRFKD